MLTLHQYGKGGYSATSGRIHQAILQGKEFKAGHMKAVKASKDTLPSSPGRLEGNALDMWHKDRPHIDYVVYSYATPIAWHFRYPGLWAVGGWMIPDTTYSHTTTRHQSLVRVALHTIGMTYDE
jgi:hypothetical protein